MKTKTKHTMCGTIVIAIIITLTLINWHTVTKSSEIYNELLTSDSRFTLATNSISHKNYAREFSFIMYLTTGDDKYIGEHERTSQRALALYDTLIESDLDETIRQSHIRQKGLLTSIINLERNSIIGTAILDKERYNILKSELETEQDKTTEFIEVNVKEKLGRVIEQGEHIRSLIIMLTIVAITIVIMCIRTLAGVP